MSNFNVGYGFDYLAIPKTLRVTDSGAQGSYTAAYERMSMPHMLTCTCDLYVEGTAASTLDTTRSTYWKAGDALFFRPDNRHPTIFYQRADSAPFDVNNYVTISLVVPDNVADTVRRTLINYTDGTFTRASQATRLTSATTISTSPVNAIRLENRGDFTLPLFEGQRTNRVTRSVINSAYWPTHDSTITNNYAAAPDGLNTAARVEILYADTYGPGSPTILDTTSPVAISFWAKSTTGSGDTIRMAFGAGPNGPPHGLTFYCTDTWQYGTASGVIMPDTDSMCYNGMLNRPTPGDPALPTSDTLGWGAQLEQAYFSSSYIPTNGVAGARSPDSNLFTTSQYDPDVCTLGGDFYCALEYLPAEPADGTDFWFINFDGAGDGIVLAKSASGARVECRVGGSVVLASNYLTWARFGRIDVSFRPSQGLLTVANAASGNGTTTSASFTLPNSSMRQAGYYGGTGELYGRLSNTTIVI